LSLTFSPDGSTVVSAGADRTIRVWDAKSLKPTRPPLRGHEDSVNSVVISPDGKIIASGSDDQTIRLWDAQTGQPIGAPLRGHENVVSSVAFSPDGKTIASGSGDLTLRLWNAKSGQEITPTELRTFYTTGIKSVTFSPDGQTLAVSWDDNGFGGMVSFWDIKSGKEIPLYLIRPDTAVSLFRGIYAIAFSPDGQFLAGAASLSRPFQLGYVVVWNMKTGDMRTFPRLPPE
jgi:WD40 repeat protein